MAVSDVTEGDSIPSGMTPSDPNRDGSGAVRQCGASHCRGSHRYTVTVH